MNLLQNIKWNGCSYPLETHVSNHRQAVDNIQEFSQHITVTVPDDAQRVEYVLDSIQTSDNTLQAALALVRASQNNMRTDFKTASTYMIEVDPYKCGSQRPNSGKQRRGTGVNISAIDFSAVRGSSG